jgi:hypothetical protein
VARAIGDAGGSAAHLRSPTDAAAEQPPALVLDEWLAAKPAARRRPIRRGRRRSRRGRRAVAGSSPGAARRTPMPLVRLLDAAARSTRHAGGAGLVPPIIPRSFARCAPPLRADLVLRSGGGRYQPGYGSPAVFPHALSASSTPPASFRQPARRG